MADTCTITHFTQNMRDNKKRSAGIKLIVYPVVEALACPFPENKQCRAHAVQIYALTHITHQ